MKKYIGVLVALLVISLAAFGQRGEEREAPHAEHAAPPTRGPAPVRGNPHPAQEKRNYSDKAGHPNVPHVDKVISGWATTRARMTRITTSIVLGSTATSRAALALAIAGGSQVAVRAVSGLAVSTLASLRMILASAMAGSGAPTKSSFTTIPITSDGTLLTT